MAIYLSEELRTEIYRLDRGCCAYCQTCETNSGIPLTHDHIMPRSKSGNTTLENVCLACRPCNEFKSDLIEAIDPLTSDIVPLFNPRTQKWTDHFEWSEDGLSIIGLTSIGRATVVALRMNNPVILAARNRWVSGRWHPPVE